MRADKFNIVGIHNMKRSDGTYIFEPGDGERLRKDVDYYTMTCPECDTEGRIDHRGEVVCDNDYCGLVLSAEGDKMIYPENYAAKRMNEAAGGTGAGSRGSSGHPLMRVPALSDAGPSHDDGL